MTVFSIDVQLAATLYIVADTLEEAQAKLEAFELYEDIRESIEDCMFDELEGESISPAMTYYGPYPGQTLQEA